METDADSISDYPKRLRTKSEQMPDRYSPTKRSAIMASVKAANTHPEITVRRMLHRLGYRFRLHRRELPGTPDLVLRKHRVVIFVHGCFWHQHDCRRGRNQPASNQHYWRPKIARNVVRDSDVRTALQQLGWRVLIVWECQVKDPDLPNRLDRFLRHPSPLARNSDTTHPRFTR